MDKKLLAKKLIPVLIISVLGMFISSIIMRFPGNTLFIIPLIIFGIVTFGILIFEIYIIKILRIEKMTQKEQETNKKLRK